MVLVVLVVVVVVLLVDVVLVEAVVRATVVEVGSAVSSELQPNAVADSTATAMSEPAFTCRSVRCSTGE